MIWGPSKGSPEVEPEEETDRYEASCVGELQPTELQPPDSAKFCLHQHLLSSVLAQKVFFSCVIAA